MTTSLPVGPAGRAVERVGRHRGVPSRRRRAASRDEVVDEASNDRPSLPAPAPVGSPSTPLAQTAPDPVGAQSPGELAMGRRGAGDGQLTAHEVGPQASSSEVSVCPAWASPPAMRGHHDSTRRPSPSERRHGPFDGLAVPAVAVDEHDAVGPVGRPDELDDHRVMAVGADRERAGEVGVLAAGGDADRRGDDEPGRRLGEARGEGLGDDRVRAQRQVRAVLFARPERHAQHGAPFGHLGPGHLGQPHGLRTYPVSRRVLSFGSARIGRFRRTELETQHYGRRS